MAFAARGISFLSWISILFLQRCTADLPIHCTLRDVAGDWIFQLGPASAVDSKVPGCGHHIPNSVMTALDIDHEKVVPADTAQKMEITLTEDIAMQPQRHLIAHSNGKEGMWTMVFDTGLEARVDDKSLFAHFLFSEMPNTDQPAKNGDNFQNIQQYVGRNGSILAPMGKTYACYCNVLTTGFWHRRTPDGKLEAGCFWGAKKDSFDAHGKLKKEHAPPSALVALKHRKDTAARVVSSNASLPGASSFSIYSSSDMARDSFESHGGMFKEVVYTNRRPAETLTPGQTVPQVVSLRGVAPHARNTSKSADLPIKLPPLAGSEAKEIGDGLPRAFDWREELADMVPKGYDPLGEQVDQGPCGSCYAFAGVLMLQMRFRVQLYRKHGILYPVEMSYKSAARCSPYTEGCSGGFSYLTMRLASEIGVPQETCDAKVSAGALDETCDWSCYKDNKNLFFAKDYWHVGGFSHGSDEKSIMREIYMNGPVELGFSTSAIPEFVSRSGQSVSNSTDTMTIILNDRAPKEPYSTNSKIQPWVFSTHAILGVGWGEETVSWGMVKYWTVRNSWGRDWGINGYAKMRRGNNDGGIETDATMAIPDMDRLPEGFLEKATAYHESMKEKRVEWRKAPAPKKPPKAAKKGTPEYCKQRPDSIDCN